MRDTRMPSQASLPPRFAGYNPSGGYTVMGVRERDSRCAGPDQREGEW
jgi:hypothetical protein